MSSSRKRLQVLLILGVVILGIVLFLLPKQPASVRTIAEEKVTSNSSDMAQALELVNSGQDPMKGIMMLREMVEEDSTNVEAQFYLGIFSLQSGQMEKARQRFETVLAIDSTSTDGHYQLASMDFDEGNYSGAAVGFEKIVQLEGDSFPNAWFFLARSLEFAGEDERALQAYEKFLPLSADTNVTVRVEQFISDIEKRINR